MDIEDDVLNALAENQAKVRMRIPVSRNNQNTTFEWFDFNFAGPLEEAIFSPSSYEMKFNESMTPLKEFDRDFRNFRRLDEKWNI